MRRKLKQMLLMKAVLLSVMLCCSISVQAASCDSEGVENTESGSKSKPSFLWKPIEPYDVLDGIVSISTGRVFDGAGYGWKPGISYAIAEDGTAWFWGNAGQIAAFPERIQGLNDVRQISGSYALTTGGQVWRLDEEKSPVLVEGLNEIRSIQQVEMYGTLWMLKQDGSVWRLEQEKIMPEQVQAFEHISEIYGSQFSLFVLDEDGKLLYLDGRSGGNMVDRAAMPLDIPDQVVKVAVGGEDQALIHTGRGEMFVFSPEDKRLERVPMADEAQRMAVGGSGTFLFVKADGSVWGWGENRNGMLGENQPEKVQEPVAIEGLADITDIQAGTDHALALDGNSQVYSWGSNMTGQLGRVPVMFDRWTEIGEMDGIQQVVTRLGRPYFVREDGSVWSLHDDRTAYEVKGPANIRMMTSVYGVPITLSTDGKVRLWPQSFEASETLSVPFQVKDIVGGEDHLLLQSEDDRFMTVKFKPEIGKQGDRYVTKALIPEKLEVAHTDAAWAVKVKSLYANNYTFLALTDDGQVYYADKAEDAPYTFKLVPGLLRIKQLAPEYFVRYTLDPASVWALDESGRVYEIVVTRVQADGPKLNSVEVTVSAAKEDGIAAVSGRLRITKDGHIFEQDWSPSEREPIPDPVRLVSSSYSYAIEGPGSHYHLLVTSSDKLVVIGYNPFGVLSSMPDKVVVSARGEANPNPGSRVPGSGSPPEDSSAGEPSSLQDKQQPASGDISAAGLLTEMRQSLGIEPAKSGSIPEPPADIPAWLQQLAARYDGKREPIQVNRFDLEGEGGLQARAAVLFVEAEPAGGAGPMYTSRQSVGIIVTKTAGAFLLDAVEFQEDPMSIARVEMIGDLTGDGNNEIVWRWGIVGAHTTTFDYVVSHWSKDRWVVVPGKMTKPSTGPLSLQNGALVLQGGLIGSAGAGPWQRESTDVYRYRDGRMTLVDSFTGNTETAYHRLNDAVTSEALAYWERAAQEYKEAALQTDESYEGLLLEYRKELVEGGKSPELEERFRDAVHAFARLRLRLLELDGKVNVDYSSSLGPDTGAYAGLSEALKDASNREEACKAAKKWTDDQPEWLELLNAPFGYANSRWDADSVCAILNNVKDEH